MVNCSLDEKDITPQKFGAKFGISVITIIYFIYVVFIIILIYRRGQIKETKRGFFNKAINILKNNEIKYSDTFTGRFNEWFTKAGHSINSGSVLAILAAGVVIGFNGLIMTPIITTMFPDQINSQIQIPGRNIYINPGQFFIALIGFVISLIIFFFIAELINILKQKFGNSLGIIILVLLFVFLTFMLIWNAIHTDELLNKPDCVPISTSVAVFQNLKNGNKDWSKDMSDIYNGGIKKESASSLPPFGVFG